MFIAEREGKLLLGNRVTVNSSCAVLRVVSVNVRLTGVSSPESIVASYWAELLQLDCNPLDLVETDLICPSVTEASCPRTFMVRHLLSNF